MDMQSNMCIDVNMDMYVDISADMCMNTCTKMCIGMCIGTVVGACSCSTKQSPSFFIEHRVTLSCVRACVRAGVCACVHMPVPVRV